VDSRRLLDRCCTAAVWSPMHGGWLQCVRPERACVEDQVDTSRSDWLKGSSRRCLANINGAATLGMVPADCLLRPASVELLGQQRRISL